MRVPCPWDSARGQRGLVGRADLAAQQRLGQRAAEVLGVDRSAAAPRRRRHASPRRSGARRVVPFWASRSTVCSRSSALSGTVNTPMHGGPGGVGGAHVVGLVRPWCERHPEVLVDVGGHPQHEMIDDGPAGDTRTPPGRTEGGRWRSNRWVTSWCCCRGSSAACCGDGKDVWAPTPGAIGRALWSLGRSVRSLELTAPTRGSTTTSVTAWSPPRLMPDVHLMPGLWKIDGYCEISR